MEAKNFTQVTALQSLGSDLPWRDEARAEAAAQKPPGDEGALGGAGTNAGPATEPETPSKRHKRVC